MKSAKKFFKKSGVLFLALIIIASSLVLTSCESETVDDSLTMYVGLGNTASGYYEKIQAAILENTGIEVTLVYNNTNDTSNAILSRIENYDLPADIMVTAAKIPYEAQQTSFLDLASYTNIPDLFNTTKISSLSVDGSIYQIPYTTRLIGIEYNKTLMEEMGWELPQNFEDMVQLKEKAEAAGYKFAVSGGVATGHGFNYLMHIMGVDFIASPDGESWLSGFISGEKGIEEFAAHTEYFEKYAEAGLFGSVHDGDWNAKTEFSRERALFYYNTINDIASYDGLRYNSDGTIYGAAYDAKGNVQVVEAEDGEAVYYNDEYVLYDEDNENHKGLCRYHIEGAEVLHDEYGIMPWISENGNNNCLTTYDNMYLALDKKLGEEEYKEKFNKAVKVLEYMATDEAAQIFRDIYADGYVAVKGTTIDESRMYYEYKDSVEKGYLMSWYYNYFDSATVVGTGQEVNNYIKGEEGASMDKIIEALDENNSAYVNRVTTTTTITSSFTLEECAGLQAVLGAASLQKALEEQGINEEIQVSLIPYTEDIKNLPTERGVAVVQERLYEGAFDHSRYRSIMSSNATTPVAIYMTGKEINDIITAKYDLKENYELSGLFPYKCVTKEGLELEEDETYLVAVSEKCLSKSTLSDFESRNMIIKSGDEIIRGNTETEFLNYLQSHKSMAPEDFKFLQ